MGAIWLTSDLHVGHEKIAQLRGYQDPLDHDAAMARIWRKQVRDGDVVWVLGDISSGGVTAQKEALLFLSELPGKKYLIAGNHDSIHPMHGWSANLRWEPEYREVFDYTCSHACFNIEGEKVLLSHFPYSMDHTEDPRFMEWRLNQTDKWLLHGHTHYSRVWHPGHPREYHVGWDAHKGLVNQGRIATHIRERKRIAANNRSNSSLLCGQ